MGPFRDIAHRGTRLGAVDHFDDRDRASNEAPSNAGRRHGLCYGAGWVEQLLSDRSCLHHDLRRSCSARPQMNPCDEAKVFEKC